MNKRIIIKSAVLALAGIAIIGFAAWKIVPREIARDTSLPRDYAGAIASHAGHDMGMGSDDRAPGIASAPPAAIPVPERQVPGALYKTLNPQAYSTYPLRSVGVHSGNDNWMPNLSVATTKEVAASGKWSAIFPHGSLSATDIVRIPKGISVIYDVSTTSPVGAVVVVGSLAFSTTTPTALSVGTILVEGGSLSIDASKTKADITFSGSLSSEKDPMQITLGLVAAGGTVNIKGRALATPFAYADGTAGSKTLQLDRAVDWRVGDEVYVSSGNDTAVDSAYWAYNHRDVSLRNPFPETGERAKVASVQGTVVTLDRALAYGHKQATVADVTRSVTFRSDSKNTGSARGHFMLAGMTDASVMHARFYDLGRTTIQSTDDTTVSAEGKVTHVGSNERGRYALHAHHLMKSFVFEGNVVDGSDIMRKVGTGSERAVFGSPKWGIVNHDSNGVIRKNVVIGAAGAGIVGEDGTETGVVENNLVIGTGGGSGDNDDERFGTTKSLDMAHGGFGYWFRGPFLEVRNNVAAGHFNQAGYTYFTHPGFVREFIRADAGVPADLKGKAQADMVSANAIRQFKGNAAVGYFGNAGFTMLYSQVYQPLDSFTMKAFGSGDIDGVVARIMKGITLSNSSLEGTGKGTALVASESEGVTPVNTRIDRFEN